MGFDAKFRIDNGMLDRDIERQREIQMETERHREIERE